MMPDQTARRDAETIWEAGVDSVRAQPLVQRSLSIDGDSLVIDGRRWSSNDFDRLIVVGAGKAATAMAAGLVEAVGNWLPIGGWVNVPEGTAAAVEGITVHEARPAGVNEPTEAGVKGTKAILQMVREAGERDLCIALISGGGSALLPAPAEGIALQEKLALIRQLSAGGADIVELNTVRKQISSVKGGGLLAVCGAKQMVTLILSDVLGDPIDMIASGPTVADTTTATDALAVLAKYDPERQLAASIYRHLERSASATPADDLNDRIESVHMILGNNAVAVDEAGIVAERLGFNHAMQSARQCEGEAEVVGRHLAEMTIEMLHPETMEHPINCLITGGEPTVTLAPESERGLGGRNQQLVLAAYQRLRQADLSEAQWRRLAILSGGTDGEDGPTDAAGAVLCDEVHRRAESLGLDPADYLRRNDAYEFFRQTGGLLMTGPTGTNVCDVRVAVVRPATE